MPAEVTSLARMLREHEEGEGKKELVTRDLLGVGGVGMMHRSAEVDLELSDPDARERCLDLASVRTYLHKSEADRAPRRYNDLTPTIRPPSFHLFLDLEANPPSSVYQSVCTLENVKSALERAVREKRFPDSCSSTIITSSMKRKASDDRSGGSTGLESPSAAMVVAGCPVCLLYVFVWAAKPRCPRCAAHVPVHGESQKRHKFNLNTTSQDGES